MQYVVLTVWFLSLCSTCLSVHIVASVESIFLSAVEDELTAGICHSFIHLLVHGHWHCSKFGTFINELYINSFLSVHLHSFGTQPCSKDAGST